MAHEADEDREQVGRIVDDLRAAAKSYTIDDMRSGGWFERFLHHCVETYAKKVNAQYFADRYPGLPPDVVVSRQITLAKRYAALEGGLSGGAYSTAVAFTLGSGGGASPVAGPAALASFTVDLLFTTQLQFRLAYDMAVLYGVPIDVDDPEDLVDLMKVAFGVKAGALAQEALLKVAPEAVRQGTRAVFKGALLKFLQGLPVIGKHLLQRNLVKFAIPFVSIPLSAGMNYLWTAAIADRARDVFRNRAALHEEARNLVASGDRHMLLLKTVWFIAKADGKYSEGEAMLLRSITTQLAAHGESEEVLTEFAATVNLDLASLATDIEPLEQAEREQLFHAAVVAAAVDREVHKREVDALAELATICGVAFAPADVHREVERLRGGGH